MSFTESSSIHLEDLIFEHCGAVHSSTSINSTTNNSTLNFYSSMYLFSVTDFTMTNVAIENSNGLGLALFDVDGLVAIRYCVFKNNRVGSNDTGHIPGGGGMYVEFTYCPPGMYDENCTWYSAINHSVYTISNSTFANNNASQVKSGSSNNYFSINNRARFTGFGRGGGLQVTFKGYSTGNSITIYNCTFYKNVAIWGGGLKVTFQDESKNNSLLVANSTFHQNTCFKNGGGGVNVGYTFFEQPFPANNKIVFTDCNFTENKAKFGGGLAFYSSDSTSSTLNNTIEFNNCTWRANKARYGSAISMSVQAWTTYLSGNLPAPIFTNTKFVGNSIIDQLYSPEKDVWKRSVFCHTLHAFIHELLDGLETTMDQLCT